MAESSLRKAFEQNAAGSATKTSLPQAFCSGLSVTGGAVCTRLGLPEEELEAECREVFEEGLPDETRREASEKAAVDAVSSTLPTLPPRRAFFEARHSADASGMLMTCGDVRCKQHRPCQAKHRRCLLGWSGHATR